MDADEDTKTKMNEEAPSQLDKIITNGFKGLGLEYFFTAGPDEVRVSKNHNRSFEPIICYTQSQFQLRNATLVG